ncbi:hypothetical protein [Seleniivibrio woodruffii]|uniref:hypothetical protein n=1 Tax=Seleniivibrio woodruffii TaxID=1078050 RepID=UPI0026F0EFB1|nr:hypothetical protein [Seleniivibrio woodruffii]
MNIKKLKQLPAASLIKLSLPLAVLFCVFFLRSVIESSMESIVSERFGKMRHVFDISIPEEDAEFTKALTTGKNPEPIEPFDMSHYLGNPFIAGFFNRMVTQQTTAQTGSEVSAEIQAEKPSAPEYVVSAVMNGRNKKCAVVNGRLINQGENVDNYSRLTAVDDSRVLLEGYWGKKWYYVQY